MRVLIHATGVSIGGAQRHLSNLMPQLASEGAGHSYVVLVPESFSLVPISENIRLIHQRQRENKSGRHKLKGISIKRLFWDLVLVPLLAKRHRCDIIVSLVNFGPIWTSVPHVVFQRNSLYFCDHHLSTVTGREKLITILRRSLAIRIMRRASAIIVPSDAMAKMIEQHCPTVNPHKLHTLHHGFDRSSYGERLGNDLGVKLLRPGPKLIYPSHGAKHKAFDILLEMMAALKNKHQICLVLTIASDAGSEEGSLAAQVRDLGIENSVLFTGSVPQPQMGEVYRQCDLMVFPSVCESFGFPLVEAMGHGLPIVAADTAVNREICGDAALYYPPLDPIAGSRAVIAALEENTYRALTMAGSRRIKEFDWSWREYAAKFVRILNEVYATAR